MKSFILLMKKELENTKWPVLLFSFLTLLFHFILSTQAHRFPDIEVVIGLACLPVVFIPLWLIWSGFQIYRTEWSHNTSYLLLSLPVSGIKITTAKLLTLILEFMALVGMMIAGLFIFLRQQLYLALNVNTWFDELYIPWQLVFSNAMMLFVVLLIGVVILLMISQFVYISSRFARRARGLVTVWVFVLTFWFTNKLAYLLEPLFRWMPATSLTTITSTEGSYFLVKNQIVLSGEYSTLFVAIVLFILSSYLFERHIEL
ncbi:MAG: hypothetical protein GX020_00530 [Firmicutes bacterium]|nr:hypothetical protein [Bacillota bacterium]